MPFKTNERIEIFNNQYDQQIFNISDTSLYVGKYHDIYAGVANYFSVYGDENYSTQFNNYYNATGNTDMTYFYVGTYLNYGSQSNSYYSTSKNAGVQYFYTGSFLNNAYTVGSYYNETGDTTVSYFYVGSFIDYGYQNNRYYNALNNIEVEYFYTGGNKTTSYMYGNHFWETGNTSVQYFWVGANNSSQGWQTNRFRNIYADTEVEYFYVGASTSNGTLYGQYFQETGATTVRYFSTYGNATSSLIQGEVYDSFNNAAKNYYSIYTTLNNIDFSLKYINSSQLTDVTAFDFSVVNSGDSQFKMYNNTGYYIGFSPSALTTDTLYIWPEKPSISGKTLSCDDNGNLSWIDNNVSANGYFYLGDPNTTGTWRFSTSGSTLNFDYLDGTWRTGSTITATY